MLPPRTIPLAARLASFSVVLALALTAGPALADRPDKERGRGNGHANGHGNGNRHTKDRDDRPDLVIVERNDRPNVIVVDRRPVIVVGRALPRDAYLDPALYDDAYGRRIDDRYRYAETYDGTRILVDIATGVIAEILNDALGIESPRPIASSGPYRVPPGHYPPPGLCRVWYPDLPPGHQPPAGSCNVRVPRGAVLIGG